MPVNNRRAEVGATLLRADVRAAQRSHHSMTPHTAYPRLADLPELVKKQRRLLAGQLRITAEERALRVEIAGLLEQAGATEVSCECEIGGALKAFDIRPYQSSRDGKRRVKIFPTR